MTAGSEALQPVPPIPSPPLDWRERIPKWAPAGAVQLGFTLGGLLAGLALRTWKELGEAWPLAFLVMMVIGFAALTYINWHLKQDAQEAKLIKDGLSQAQRELEKLIGTKHTDLGQAIADVRKDLALALSVRFQRISRLNSAADDSNEDYLTQLMRQAKKSVFIVDLISNGAHVNDALLKDDLRKAYYDTLIKRAKAEPGFHYTRICQFDRSDMTLANMHDDTFIGHCRQMAELYDHGKTTLKQISRVFYPTTFGIVDGQWLYLDLAPSPEAPDAHLRGELIIEDRKHELLGPFEEAFRKLSDEALLVKTDQLNGVAHE